MLKQNFWKILGKVNYLLLKYNMASQNVSRGNLSISGKTFISDTSLDSSVNNIAVIDSNGEIKIRGVDTLNNTYITGGSYNCTTSTLSLNNVGGSALGTAISPYLRFGGSNVALAPIVYQSVMDSDGNLYAVGSITTFENTSDVNDPNADYPYRWELDGVAKLNYPSYELDDAFKTHGDNYGLLGGLSISIDSSKNIYISHPSQYSISGVSAPMGWSVIDIDGTINTSIDFQSHILLNKNSISSTRHVFVNSNDKIILAGPFTRYSGTSVTYANQMIGLEPNGSVYGNFHQVPLDSTNIGGLTNTWPNFYEDPDGNIYFCSEALVTTGSTVIYDLFRTDSLGNFDSNFTPFTVSPIGLPRRVKVHGDYVYLMGHYSSIDGVSQTSNIGGVNYYPGIIRFNKINGTWDSSYKLYFSKSGGNPEVFDVHFYDDGSVLAIGEFDYYSGTSLTSRGIVKIKSDLTIDTTTDFGTGFGSPSGIGVNLHTTPDNNLLITGLFKEYSSDDQWESIVKMGNNTQSIDIPFNVCDTFTGGTSSGTTITIEGGCCNDIVITGVTGVYVTGATADYTGVTLTRNDDVNVLIDSEQTIRTKYTGVTVGTTTLVTIPVAQFFGTHIEYAVTNGTGVRTGILIGSFEGGTKVEMSDVCTADTTDFSSDFEFDITASGQVQAVVTSGTYTIVFNTRAIEI